MNPYSLYRETTNDGTVVTSIELVMTPETRLKHAATAYFKEQDNLQYLSVVGGARQRAGVSDFLLTINGRSVSMELKAPSGRKSDGSAWDRCTALQKQWLRETRDAGGVAAACDTLEQVKQVVSFAWRVIDEAFIQRVPACVVKGDW